MNKKLIIIILALIFLTLSTLSSGETLLRLNLISRSKGEFLKINMLMPYSILKKIIESEESFKINKRKIDRDTLTEALSMLKNGEVFETEIKDEKTGETILIKINSIERIEKAEKQKVKKMIIQIKDNEDSLDISIPISLVKIFSSIIKNSIEDDIGESKVLLDYILSPYKYINHFGNNEIPLVEIRSSNNEYVKISFQN